MTKALEPPFEIYNGDCDIADKNGHVCTAENAEIAKEIIAALHAMAESRKIRDALDKMAEAHPVERGAVLREQHAAEARGYARGRIAGYAEGIADAAKARTPEP